MADIVFIVFYFHYHIVSTIFFESVIYNLPLFSRSRLRQSADVSVRRSADRSQPAVRAAHLAKVSRSAAQSRAQMPARRRAAHAAIAARHPKPKRSLRISKRTAPRFAPCVRMRLDLCRMTQGCARDALAINPSAANTDELQTNYRHAFFMHDMHSMKRECLGTRIASRTPMFSRQPKPATLGDRSLRPYC